MLAHITSSLFMQVSLQVCNAAMHSSSPLIQFWYASDHFSKHASKSSSSFSSPSVSSSWSVIVSLSYLVVSTSIIMGSSFCIPTGEMMKGNVSKSVSAQNELYYKWRTLRITTYAEARILLPASWFQGRYPRRNSNLHCIHHHLWYSSCRHQSIVRSMYVKSSSVNVSAGRFATKGGC